MPLFEVIRVIVPIVIIVSIGFIFAKFREVTLKTFADYIIYISSPALALSQLAMQKAALPEILSLSFSAVVVIVGCGSIAFLLFKIFKFNAPKGIYLPVMFMNSGFIGFPLALFAFGSAGLNKILIFNMVNALLLFTLGIYVVSHKKDPWQVLKIPYLYASVIGLSLSLTGIRLPQYIYSPLYILGGTTIPLALFMLGCRLARIKIVSWKLPVVATVLRLGLGLLLGFLAVFVFRLSGLTAKIVILAASLSSAVTTLPLAEEYDAEPELVASAIALSTLVSFILIIVLLNWLL